MIKQLLAFIAMILWLLLPFVITVSVMYIVSNLPKESREVSYVIEQEESK